MEDEEADQETHPGGRGYRLTHDRRGRCDPSLRALAAGSQASARRKPQRWDRSEVIDRGGNQELEANAGPLDKEEAGDPRGDACDSCDPREGRVRIDERRALLDDVRQRGPP